MTALPAGDIRGDHAGVSSRIIDFHDGDEARGFVELVNNAFRQAGRAERAKFEEADFYGAALFWVGVPREGPFRAYQDLVDFVRETDFEQWKILDSDDHGLGWGLQDYTTDAPTRVDFSDTDEASRFSEWVNEALGAKGNPAHPNFTQMHLDEKNDHYTVPHATVHVPRVAPFATKRLVHDFIHDHTELKAWVVGERKGPAFVPRRLNHAGMVDHFRTILDEELSRIRTAETLLDVVYHGLDLSEWPFLRSAYSSLATAVAQSMQDQYPEDCRAKAREVFAIHVQAKRAVGDGDPKLNEAY